MTMKNIADLEAALAALTEEIRTLRLEPPVRRPSAPPGPRMETIVAKVPEEWVVLLDAIGPSRSEAIRRLLGKALANASGARLRKAGE